MSESISLDFIGKALRDIQAEQRTLRMENGLMRQEMGRMASREVLAEVLNVLVDRIANFEALTETRFDQLGVQLSRIEEKTGGGA